VIGSVTRPFCGARDRVRLTADGQIGNCLFARDESDLRTQLWAGADDDHAAIGVMPRRRSSGSVPGLGGLGEPRLQEQVVDLDGAVAG
jgi:cyclic pyranopterin phosphate synthase